MFLLPVEDLRRVRPLFRKIEMHLALQALLAGELTAPVYVDDLEHPHLALTRIQSRIYLAGKPGSRVLAESARTVFFGTLMREALQDGRGDYLLFYPDQSWEPFIGLMLKEREPYLRGMQYYAFKQAKADWRGLLPAGMELRAVDAALLAGNWHNPDFLTDEMLSERPSLADFLQKSFGVCLTRADEILGWCLSEYNTHHRCEVGLAIRSDLRQRGLGTLLALAFVEMAQARDVARVGWHCNARNFASGKTALKAGFEHLADYPVYLGSFDPALNMGQRAYFELLDENFANALACYEKSLALPDAPDWAYFGAGCAAAMLGQSERALTHLAAAVERGAADADDLRGTKFLTSLRENLEFNLLLEKLDQQAEKE
ncbi:MAG: GNAT family N-acetyltransferase [Anaerolineales bacterium]|nr:GNAT family N-acetyltransferase [Anaerolineales bacterium]